jgi:hypothetical protein
MQKEIIKINMPNKNLTFSEREKFINTETQKIMESYNNRGYIVISHSILNKSGSGVSVQFDIQQMPR